LQELACVDNFLPTRKEIVDLLLSTSDMEGSSMQQSLSSALLRVHLQQQSMLMQQLLQHSATLLSLLQRQRGQLERSGRLGNPSLGMAKDWDLKLSEASEKQRRLAAQVSEVSLGVSGSHHTRSNIITYGCSCLPSNLTASLLKFQVSYKFFLVIGWVV